VVSRQTDGEATSACLRCRVSGGSIRDPIRKVVGLPSHHRVAGRGILFAESLIDKSKGDAIIDYRNGDEAIIAG
jgi:hypothetical protein